MSFRTQLNITDDRLIKNGVNLPKENLNINLTTSAETNTILDLDFTFISNEDETIFNFKNNVFIVPKKDLSQIKKENLNDNFILNPIFFKTNDNDVYSGVSMVFLISEINEMGKNSFSGNGFTHEYYEYEAFSYNKKETPKDSVTITKYEITTESILAEDNKIELNFGGNNESALAGGLTIIDGVKDGEDSTIKIDDKGNWVFYPGIKSETIILPKNKNNKELGSLSWDNDYLYLNTESGTKKVKLEDI